MLDVYEIIDMIKETKVNLEEEFVRALQGGEYYLASDVKSRIALCDDFLSRIEES